MDYGIVHKYLLNEIEFFKVSELEGHISDHCPISFGFKCSYKTTEFKHDIYPLNPNFNVCIDKMLSKVENILNSAAQCVVKERKIGSKSKTKKKKWFDINCYALRKEVIG